MNAARALAKTSENSGHPVFGRHAERMAALGLAVVPLGHDRKPLVAGFNKWSHRPSLHAVARWAQKFPGANIGILPGPSGLWVADVDDAHQVSEVEELLGPTPLHVITNRGEHLYYARPCERVPGTLRNQGLNVDLKAGNSVVIAPPSIHASGHRYRHKDADWSVLSDLPRPDLERLRQLLRRESGRGLAKNSRDMRDGSRKQWLNDLLCKHVAFCDTFNELLDKARTANSELPNWGHEPLDDATVIDRARKVWTDRETGKLEKWIGNTGIARIRKSEILALSSLDPKGAGDAVALLTILRIAHGARCRRGETFCITPHSMAHHDVIPGWARQRYMRARNLLIEGKLLEKVSSFQFKRNGRHGARYRLPSSKGVGAV
jgi:hypothetical protein